MRELDAATSVFVNVLLPSQKRVSKTRQGAKIRKRSDAPQTPLQRVLSSPWVAEETKKTLREKALTLNPGRLAPTINCLRSTLMNLATPLAPTFPKTEPKAGAGLRHAAHPSPNPILPQRLNKAPGFAHTAHSPDKPTERRP